MYIADPPEHNLTVC